jgi:hypothetical protein
MTTAITTIGTTTAITTATRLYPGLGRKAGPCPLLKSLSFHLKL